MSPYWSPQDEDNSQQLGYRGNILQHMIARRNINNLRHAYDTTLMAESEEEQKSLLMKVKVESKEAGLKPNIQKMKIMASSPMETVTDFIFLGS